ncbi:MAG: DNA repair protein RecO [Bacteroidales bacterium]|nr:DNA repair protein RecO [Bacteroidales bacterium]
MIVNTRAIVLSHLRYGESSLIVHLYTEQLGRQAVFIKGAYNKKSSMRTALFQPLHLLEIEIHYRSNRQMQRISNVRLLQPLHNILFDPVKNSIALFTAELLYKTLREEEAYHELFGFLLHSIQTLDLIDKGIANFHLIFMIHYTRYLGFYPNMDDLSENAWFDAQKGNFTIYPSKSSPDPEYNQLLAQLFGTSFNHISHMKMNHLQRNYFTEYLLTYYEIHVDNFGKMKSFAVLKDVFQNIV